MRCLIVDSNRIARTAMEQLVDQVAALQLVAECSNAMEAYNYLTTKNVDLFLLDIELSSMNGLEFIKKLGTKSPLIIFTTAMKDYAVETFKLNVVDYLVKPVQSARFMQAIEKSQQIFKSIQAYPKASKQDLLFVEDNGSLKKINEDAILYIEKIDDYVKVYTEPFSYKLNVTLESMEARLQP